MILPRNTMARVSILLLFWCLACKDMSQDLPAGTSIPTAYFSNDGAQALYSGTRLQSMYTLRDYIVASGLIADEFQSGTLASSSTEFTPNSDRRVLGDGTVDGLANLYASLHAVRNNANNAYNIMLRYGTDLQDSKFREVLVLHGFAVVLLGELYCSGVPLSTLDFDGDYTYKPGSSTTELFRQAIRLFDSAMAFTRVPTPENPTESDSIISIAKILKGRALLNLDLPDSAALVVADVPTAAKYQLPIFGGGIAQIYNYGQTMVMADGEGQNGLLYISMQDPRVISVVDTTLDGRILIRPGKYMGPNPAGVVASGLEARLIEVEAALRNGGDWLKLLNALRTNGSATVTTEGDTLWQSGEGKVQGLAPLQDPQAMPSRSVEAQRIDLLFAERAFWLYGTGARFGDLRRLIRQYDRPQNQVFPTGTYLTGAFGQYGDEVTVPVPPNEAIVNKFYSGCQSRDA